MHIPHIAMHTGIRNAIVKEDLLSDPKKFAIFLQDNNNNPDARLQKMIDVIKYRTYIPTKSSEEICRLTEISYTGDVSKQDAVNFLNYVHNLAGNSVKITAEQIRDSKDIDAVSEANDQIIIANMNLNLQDNATALWKIEDLLHYQNDIEVVLVNRMSDDLEHKEFIEQLIGKKIEAGLVAFLKTGEKFIFGSDIVTISHLIANEFSNTTLLVKWGLYKPDEKELLYFPNSRKPQVVIYNITKNLDENFEEWFNKGNKAEYIFLGVSENHPFQIIIIKDNNGVLHLVNTFNRPANDFLAKYAKSLTRVKPENFLNETRHHNNALAVWGGMPFEVDWYKSMLDGENIYLR